MAYRVSFSDILDFEGDAILNSLGRNGNVYGMLCEKIIAKANDKKIKDYIDLLQDMEYNKIVITAGGQLKCDNIIHIVTPVKKLDDDNNTLLKQAYTSVIDKAIEKGYKKIALPFIGTGANGYSESDAYEAVTYACGNINILEEQENRDIIDITVIAYLKKKKDKEIEKHSRNIPEEFRLKTITNYNKCEVCGAPKIEDNIVFKMSKAMGDIKEEDFLVPNIKRYKYPYDYIEDLISAYDFDEKLITSKGIDRKRKYQMRKQKSLAKIDIYRLAFVLGMSKTQLLEFMIVCGVSFSPLSKLDKFYFNYINGKYGKAKNLYDLDYLADGKLDKGENFMAYYLYDEDEKPKKKSKK